jgi:hypothetical protein
MRFARKERPMKKWFMLFLLLAPVLVIAAERQVFLETIGRDG